MATIPINKIPFVNVSPERALQLIEESKIKKYQKLAKETKFEVEEKGIVYQKECRNVNCGKHFITKYAIAKFCSPECRQTDRKGKAYFNPKKKSYLEGVGE
jgi:hypothetical protein